MIARLPYLLFASGWGFLLPYTVASLLVLALHTTAAEARVGFLGLHALLLVALIVFVAQAVRRYRTGSGGSMEGWWFWAVLFLGFLLAGAYLEFPGDGWEHLNRINAFRPETRVRDSLWAHKVAYFWAWTWLSFVPPDRQRIALDLHGAVWQTLLALQFFRFARRLGYSVGWSQLHVFAVIALFGNSIFGFFRYYALGSTVVAYVAYLRAAVAILDVADGRERIRAGFVLAATLLIMLVNHTQELVLIGVFGAAVTGARLWARLSAPHRRMIIGVAGAISIGGYALAPLVTGRSGSALDREVLRPYITFLGCCPIWDPRLTYFRTIGVHGIVAILLTLFVQKIPTLIRVLTITPLALLLLPPVVLVAASCVAIDSLYRILFILPSSFAIVSAWERLAARRSMSRPGRLAAAGGALVTVLFLGALDVGPFYGKLRFQYFRPSSTLSVGSVDAAAQWFHDRRALPEQCIVTSDAVTEWTLSAFLGTRHNVEKVSNLRWIAGAYALWAPQSADDLLGYLRALPAYRPGTVGCGFLVVDPRRLAELPRAYSWVGARSGHWPVGAADMAMRTPPGFARAAETLLGVGWRRTPVPPFYFYYERMPPRR